MILITTPGFRLFDALNRQTASQSRANGGGHNCVPNKDRADFRPGLESDHTIAVVQGLSAQCRACRVSQGCGLVGASRRHLGSPKIPDSPAGFLESQRRIHLKNTPQEGPLLQPPYSAPQTTKRPGI